MRKFNFLLIMLFAALSFTSCEQSTRTKSADRVMQEQTRQLLQEANKQIGMPAIKNYQERKLMKTILELRDDESLICYAYLYNRDAGTVGQFLGKCLGFGLPYSVQYTNPNKIVKNPYRYGGGDGGKIIPQADPNGLFMPTGLSATWLMLLDKEGNPHPVYVEPELLVSPFPLK